MSTRFTVTIRCDARLAPDCAGERTETRDTTDGFEGIAVRLLQEGWDWDVRPRRAGHTRDVCPACVEAETLSLAGKAQDEERRKNDAGTTHE